MQTVFTRRTYTQSDLEVVRGRDRQLAAARAFVRGDAGNGHARRPHRFGLRRVLRLLARRDADGAQLGADGEMGPAPLETDAEREVTDRARLALLVADL